MIKTINKRLRNKKGFTLVELVVVIAILGVISAIAVPKFIVSLDNAKLTADKATAKSLAKAAELAIAEGKIDISNLPSDPSDILTNLYNEGYLDTDQLTPQSTDGGEFLIIIDNKGRISVGIDTNGDDTIDTLLYP